MEEEYYSIGKVEEICKITKKALRYYDKMGILSPDKVVDDNGYRYYSKRNLLSVPIIKYYKQSGFKLEEMKEFLDGANYRILEKSFRRKIDELKQLESEVNLKLTSIKDWYDLIVEADMIIENHATEVSVKYIDSHMMTYLDQDFCYDYKDSIINIEFTNHIENMNNAITGPVIIKYPSFKDKMNGQCKTMRIMQETILKCNDERTTEFGGYMVVSCYHVGPHENIGETYKKIKEWTDRHGYICGEESYERYVTDYWLTENQDNFVTEVMLKISRRR